MASSLLFMGALISVVIFRKLLFYMNFGLRVALRTEYGVILFAFHFFLDKSYNARNGESKNEINNADNEVCFKRLIVNMFDNACEIIQFGNSDDVENGRILNINDEFVAYRRQNIS